MPARFPTYRLRAMAVIRKRTSQSRIATQEQRLSQGRSHRKRLSRAALGELNPNKRKFDPIELLLSATEGRVPALLPVKYSRMTASPFAFFRGAVSIMAADLAREPHTDLLVQLCGDAHVQNLGSFEGPDGRLVFDINDFDETIRGPWEWDVKRMAASIVLAGIAASHRRAACASAVEAFATSYCNSIEGLAEMEACCSAARVGRAAAAGELHARAAPDIRRDRSGDHRWHRERPRIPGALQPAP